MKADRLGIVLLVLGEAGLGAWTLFSLLEGGNMLDVLRLFSLC